MTARRLAPVVVFGLAAALAACAGGGAAPTTAPGPTAEPAGATMPAGAEVTSEELNLYAWSEYVQVDGYVGVYWFVWSLLLVRNSELLVRTVPFGQLPVTRGIVVGGIVIIGVPIVGDQAQPSCRALQSFRHLIRLYLCLFNGRT